MNSLKTIEKRHLIPRWQSLQDAVQSPELLYHKAAEIGDEKTDDIIYEQLRKSQKEWKEEKTLLAAVEFLTKQKICGFSYDTEAAAFVKKTIKSSEHVPHEIRNLFDEFENVHPDLSSPRLAISAIRKKAIIHPENAYLWLELARNYLTLGEVEKCEKALLIAKNLAPNDRYIARSIMRFYHHTNDIDKALYYVRKMENLTTDPMLLSGEIALANVANKTSKNIKKARVMIESKNYSESSLSELTSEVATMEIMSGKERQGKKLLAKAMSCPTENSFAQATWINQGIIKLPWIDELSEASLPNNYEGQIYLTFVSRDGDVDWRYLYKQCELWKKYQPFSCDPVYLGGNIAADFLEDYSDAFELSFNALNYNKENAGLINNAAYAAILNNDKENAEKLLKLQFDKSQTDEEKVLYYATKGLFDFRFGNVEDGKTSYKMSYELAKSSASKLLYLKVLVYFYRELTRIGDMETSEGIKSEIVKNKGIINDFILSQLIKKFEIM